MSFYKKLQNLWYYYKYYVLFGALVLVAIIIATVSCANKKSFDVNVLYMTHEYADIYDELDTLFSGYTNDLNGDGEANAQVITISYGTTLKEAQSAGATRAANLAAGKNVLFLVDEQNYTELKSAGFLMDISSLGNSEYLNGDRYDATASGFLSTIEGFKTAKSSYYLCVRTYDEQRAKADKAYKAQYDAAFDTLKNIISE